MHCTAIHMQRTAMQCVSNALHCSAYAVHCACNVMHMHCLCNRRPCICNMHCNAYALHCISVALRFIAVRLNVQWVAWNCLASFLRCNAVHCAGIAHTLQCKCIPHVSLVHRHALRLYRICTASALCCLPCASQKHCIAFAYGSAVQCNAFVLHPQFNAWRRSSVRMQCKCLYIELHTHGIAWAMQRSNAVHMQCSAMPMQCIAYGCTCNAYVV